MSKLNHAKKRENTLVIIMTSKSGDFAQRWYKLYKLKKLSIFNNISGLGQFTLKNSKYFSLQTPG